MAKISRSLSAACILSLYLCMWQIFCCYGIELDTNGYILYCPCMGRFGNQADQFLGALAFAKRLDRTLVLPPWVMSKLGRPGADHMPFNTYFKVEPLMEYHRVMTMEIFMDELADTVWPVGKRYSYCLRSSGDVDDKTCNPKNGTRSGPFWDNVNVDFDGSQMFTRLGFKPHSTNGWKEKFPASKHPVLAFIRAPGAFPVSREDAKLHKYLQWTDSLADKSKTLIREHLPKPFIGVHLRIGSDWAKACQLHLSTEHQGHLFASPQCLGEKFEYGKLTAEMCLPSSDIVVEQILQTVEDINAKSVFLARDKKNYDKQIIEALEDKKVKVYWLGENDPHLDLVILAQSDHYIASCVSSFSSFATRERECHGRPTSFWAFTPKKFNEKKEEL